ncbi:MAG TPA: hypothetical protein DF292_02310 [Firmicutes bacterium]|jgi:hypothetical protein|nr:hypothetical protein [Bacillota bacterium]
MGHYEPRTYRELFNDKDRFFFNCRIQETDLQIGLGQGLSGASLMQAEDDTRALVLNLRRQIEEYIRAVPEFLTTLTPLAPAIWAPPVVRRMCEASNVVGVGPMAAVAGVISEMVGEALIKYSQEVIVENGGDIFLTSTQPRRIGIYAGQSPLSQKVALMVTPEQTPVGICTSSGTVGHSLSFGMSDATVIVARSAALADAVATAAGNRVKTPDDLESVTGFVSGLNGVLGAVIIIGDKLAAWGDIQLVQM